MQKKKHILVLSQYFYPESFRINDMCVEWVKRGYKVTVLTGIPNYPQGKFYEGYGYTKKRKESWNGMEIIRIPLIPRGGSSFGLVCNYLSFVVSGFFWKIFTRVKADYVFMFEVSPMTQALVGVWYAKKHKIPCYLYVQDLWPDSVEVVTGIHSNLILGPIEKMVNYIYKRCDKIFAASQSLAEEIVKRNVSAQKVEFWPQYAEEFYVPMEKSEAMAHCSEIPNDDNFKVCFTGNIGQAQGLEILPKAAKLLQDEKVHFIIVGDGRNRESFVNAIEENDVENKFTLVGRHPAEQIPAMLGCCDAAFLSFQKEKLWSMTIPAKLQSYLACGMPIIAAAEGETERVISEAECGLCCEIGNAEALAQGIKTMLGMDVVEMGKKSRAYYESHFLKDTLMDEIQEYFK